MSQLNIPWTYQAAVIVAISRKYNIPLQALLGIYGQETSFGTNVTYSGAGGGLGAAGPFQFTPSTAKEYNYPYTNAPTEAQFAQQADAWGRLLVANNPSKSASGWAPAMRGGYTEAQAESTITGMPSGLKDAIKSAIANAGLNVPGLTPGPNSTGNNPVVNAAKNALGGINSIADLVTSTQFWLRVGEGILGVLLLILGLRAVTGGDGNPVSVAKSVGKKAAMAAVVV